VLTFASGGVGSGGHLSGELFKFLTKTDIVHVVYKGNALGLNDVLGGHVSMMFDTITTGLTHAQQGRLNMLAVTSASRSPLAPDAPTMIEAGRSGFETSAWYALLAPAKTPPDLVGRLNAEINKAFNDPAFREPFVKQGVQLSADRRPRPMLFLRSEAKRWTEVIESTGMKAMILAPPAPTGGRRRSDQSRSTAPDTWSRWRGQRRAPVPCCCREKLAPHPTEAAIIPSRIYNQMRTWWQWSQSEPLALICAVR
jgi:hypothetical protein